MTLHLKNKTNKPHYRDASASHILPHLMKLQDNFAPHKSNKWPA